MIFYCFMQSGVLKSTIRVAVNQSYLTGSTSTSTKTSKWTLPISIGLGFTACELIQVIDSRPTGGVLTPSSFHEKPMINWFTATKFCEQDDFKQTWKTLNDLFMLRNIHDDETFTNVAKNFHAWMKVCWQYIYLQIKELPVHVVNIVHVNMCQLL